MGEYITVWPRKLNSIYGFIISDSGRTIYCSFCLMKFLKRTHISQIYLSKAKHFSKLETTRKRLKGWTFKSKTNYSSDYKANSLTSKWGLQYLSYRHSWRKIVNINTRDEFQENCHSCLISILCLFEKANTLVHKFKLLNWKTTWAKNPLQIDWCFSIYLSIRVFFNDTWWILRKISLPLKAIEALRLTDTSGWLAEVSFLTILQILNSIHFLALWKHKTQWTGKKLQRNQCNTAFPIKQCGNQPLE